MNMESQTTHRPWGLFTNLHEEGGFKVKKIVVNPSSRLSLQSHKHRKEHWVIVEGEALVTVGEQKLNLGSGQYVFIPLGSTHRLENTGAAPLVLVEVQLGEYLGEDDIIRYEDDYQRL